VIKFLKDWDLHPNAIPDYKTKNQSFLDYTGILKKMGVKNHLWALQLHNPELQYIDPSSEDLTEGEITAILTELAFNPMYYFREIIKAPVPGSPVAGDFIANRANMAATWLFFNHVTTMLIMIRQMGKSFFADSLNKYLNNYACMNADTVVVTKDAPLRAKNADRLKDIESKLPPLLKKVGRHDVSNSELITVDSLNNKIRLILAQKSKLAAQNLNRGNTTTNTFIDELAYLYNIKTSLPVILSAGVKAREEARLIGQPAGILMYTSCGYLDTESGNYAYGIASKSAKWSEHLLDFEDYDELDEYVRTHSTGLFDMVLVEMNHTMLGKTDEWLISCIRESGLTKTEAQVEFMNMWQKGSTESILTRSVIEALYKHMIADPEIEINKNMFSLKWYKDKGIPIKSNTVMAIDASELLDGDSTSLLITDVLTGSTIAAGRYNSANISEFASFVFSLLKKYDKMTLIIERNSMGIAILDQLAVLARMSGMNLFERVFNNLVDDDQYKELGIRANKAMVQYETYKKHFGFRTSGGGKQSRENLYKLLTPSVKLLVNHIYDKDLIAELVRLEIKNGRIDHRSGEHDDMVIAFLLTHWFLRNAKNLRVYGINPTTVLTGVSLSEEESDRVGAERRERQRMETAVLVDGLLDVIRVNGTNSSKGYMATCRLNMIRNNMIESEVKTLNIDGRLKEIIDRKFIKKKKAYEYRERPLYSK